MESSVAGVVITSQTVDPRTDAATENLFFKRLQTRWQRSTRCSNLQQMVTLFETVMPTSIHRFSLEEIGWEADGAMDCSVSRGHTLLASLHRVLQPMGLTWTHLDGRLIILSQETAETDAMIPRIYDVTPLVLGGAKKTTTATGSRERFQALAGSRTLAETLQMTIDLDHWEMVGGPGVIVPTVVGNRCLIVVTSTWPTHLKVHAFLTKLNRMGFPRKSADSHLAKPRSLPRTNHSRLEKFGG